MVLDGYRLHCDEFGLCRGGYWSPHLAAKVDPKMVEVPYPILFQLISKYVGKDSKTLMLRNIDRLIRVVQTSLITSLVEWLKQTTPVREV